MPAFGLAIRDDVRYSFTEKCENCTTRESWWRREGLAFVVVIDYGDKPKPRQQDSFFMTPPPPIHVQLRCLFKGSRPEVNSEDLRKLRNTKRTNSNRETLQQPMSVIPVRLIDVPQHALVCFVKSLGQFFKHTPHSRY